MGGEREAALIAELLACGLVQVGVYEGSVACRAPLEMLPSYPKAMRLAADVLRRRIAPHVNRLLCGVEAVGVGAVMALDGGLPCVWFASAETPVFEGAYDILHPTVWVMLREDDYTTEQRGHITRQAERVGLQIVQRLAVWGNDDGTAAVTLSDAVEHGIKLGVIPPRLGQAVLRRG